MTVRKILGSIVLPHGNHAVAKLSNGRYAVGNLKYGNVVAAPEQFPDLDAAFAHWRKTMESSPAALKASRPNP